MAKNVFISHSSDDAKIAARICSALEDRGFECWVAPRDIDPGDNFQVSIVRAIRAAKVMVLIFSANTNNSAEVKKELVLASQHKLAVIPLRVEDVVPGEAFAYELSTRQWVDLFHNWESSIGRVAEQLKLVLADASPASLPPSTPAGSRKPGGPAVKPWAVAAGGAIAAIIAAGIVYALTHGPAAPTPPQTRAPPPVAQAAPSPAVTAPAAPPPAVTAPPPPSRANDPARALAEAIAACPEAQSIAGPGGTAPSASGLQVKLGFALLNCSVPAVQQRDLPLAAKQIEQARNLAEKLVAELPGSREYQSLLGYSHTRQGYLDLASGNPSAAVREFSADIEIRNTIARMAPGEPGPRLALSFAEFNLGKAQQAAGHPVVAKQAFGRCVEIRRALTATQPENAEWKQLLKLCEDSVAAVGSNSGR